MTEIWKFIKNCLKEHPYSTIEDSVQKQTFGEIINQLDQIDVGSIQEKIRYKKCVVLCNQSFATTKALALCWKFGMVPTPISLLYGEKHCENIIQVIQPDYIFTDDRSLGARFAHTFLCVCDELLLFSTDTGNREKLCDVELMMCTSGTTGRPKASMFTGDAIIYNVKAIADYFPLVSSDVVLIGRPLYHCAVLVGELLLSIYTGANIIFYSGEYNPISIAKIMKNKNVTVSCGTPTIFKGLGDYLSHRGEKGKLRLMALSGEYLLPEYAKKIRESFPETKIFNVYGLTEAGPRVSFLPCHLFEEIPHSVGTPLNGVEIKTVKIDGSKCNRDELGEIWIKTPSIMLGYYNEVDQNSKKFSGQWFRTGDIGCIDIGGNLYVLGRNDDMIIKSGMNIYPQEIERKILELKEIKEALVYGKLIEGIEQIFADVVLREADESTTSHYIMQQLSTLLPQYMMPYAVTIIDKLPRNASGKVIRPKKNARAIYD